MTKELIELLHNFPEINPANCTDDDVSALNAWGISANTAIEALQAENERTKSAIKTLEHLGYTNHGGGVWKPPLGKAPNFDLIDSIRAERDALAAKLVPLEADAERYRWLRDPGALPAGCVDDYPLAVFARKNDTLYEQDLDCAIDAAKGGQHEDA